MTTFVIEFKSEVAGKWLVDSTRDRVKDAIKAAEIIRRERLLSTRVVRCNYRGGVKVVAVRRFKTITNKGKMISFTNDKGKRISITANATIKDLVRMGVTGIRLLGMDKPIPPQTWVSV